MTTVTKRLNVEDAKQPDMEDALAATGIGKFHVWITITSGLCVNAANAEAWSVGYVLPAAGCDLRLDLKQKTILVTVGAVGLTAMQFFWGYLSDKLGRRNILMWTQVGALACTVCSALAPTFWLLVLFRFLNGAFVAGAAGLSFAYIGEFFAEKHRSVAILVMSTFIGVALMAIPASAWLIIPREFGYNVASWRVFVVGAGLPSLFAIVALRFSPESPKFLLQARRPAEALRVLRGMHRANGNGKEFRIIELSCGERGDASAHVRHLFSRRYALSTFLVCAMQAGVFATSGGLYLWYPDILQKISRSQRDVTACEAIGLSRSVGATSAAPNSTISHDDHDCPVDIDSAVYVQNIIIGAAYTLGYCANSALVSKVGVRNILIAFLGAAGCATLALHFVTNKTAVDVLFLALLVLSGLCVVIVSAAVVEIYPTNLRGMAVCLTMLSGRLSTIVTSSVVGYSLLWNCEATFMIFAATLIGCSLLSLLLPSKAGKNGNIK